LGSVHIIHHKSASSVFPRSGTKEGNTGAYHSELEIQQSAPLRVKIHDDGAFFLKTSHFISTSRLFMLFSDITRFNLAERHTMFGFLKSLC